LNLLLLHLNNHNLQDSFTTSLKSAQASSRSLNEHEAAGVKLDLLVIVLLGTLNILAASSLLTFLFGLKSCRVL
jgi:hypothetical protein